MYIGEIARLVLEKLTKDGKIFGGKLSDKLHTKWAFTATHVSKIVRYSYFKNQFGSMIFNFY